MAFYSGWEVRMGPMSQWVAPALYAAFAAAVIAAVAAACDWAGVGLDGQPPQARFGWQLSASTGCRSSFQQ